MNIRRAAAVGCIALVVGGIAGRIGASTAPDDAAPTTASTPVAQTAPDLSAAAVYKADAPGIVTVTDSATSAGPSVPFLPQQQQKVEQLGSGFVLDTNGDVVTNDHVVAGGSHVRVGFGGDKTYPATVVGTDPASDLAVLRVSAPHSLLHPLAFGASTATQPGDPVYAIGNPFGLQRTITAGIVSATGRDIQAPDGRTIPDAIQTDTAINHGNSGGPLLDADGHVIGVTSQIEGGTVDGNVGVGFAIPGDAVHSVAQQLIEHGHAAHAWLGVQIAGSASGKVTVAKVTAGSPAAAAGLQRGDVVTGVNGAAVGSADELAGLIAAHQPGDRIALKVTRDGNERTLTVTLADLPAAT